MFYHPEAAAFCRRCEHRIVRHTSKIHCALCVFRENMKSTAENQSLKQNFSVCRLVSNGAESLRARRRALLSVKPSCGCLLRIRIEAVRHFQQLRKMRKVAVPIVFRGGVSHGGGLHASGMSGIHTGERIFNDQALSRFQP